MRMGRRKHKEQLFSNIFYYYYYYYYLKESKNKENNIFLFSKMSRFENTGNKKTKTTPL